MPNLRLTRRAFGGMALAGAATTFAGPLHAQARLAIAAVNYPLAYFAERLAGDLAEVVFPVPPDVDPSFWRPGIADISTFQSADLILLNGAGFADWTARTTLPRSRIVATSAAFEDAYIATESVTHSHGEGGAHSHTGTASYTWLDLSQARMQAEAIASALVRSAPEAEAEIMRNLDSLATDLAALDTEAQDIGAAAAGLPVISSHPRYQYFGRAYGLTLSAVEWDANEPPDPAQWQAFETLVGETDARILIWEATPDAATLERVTSLGLQSVVFPPLANRPATGDFVASFQASLQQLRDAVSAVQGG